MITFDSREAGKEYCRRQKPDFLPKAKKSGYVCPKCGNGTGSTGDGITLDKRDGAHYKCFKCDLYADTIELYGLHYGLTDDKDIFKGIYEYYGVEIEENRNSDKSTAKRTIDPPPRADQPEAQEEPPADYTAYYRQCSTQNDFSYLQGRGISPQTQRKFLIGYDPAWINPRAIKTTLQKGGNPDNLPRSPRCIIPTSRHSYLARDTRQDIPEKEKGYSKSKVGNVEIFNIYHMGEASTVFVTEGEIDAMSIYEASGGGAYAVGLGSTSCRRAFLEHLQKHYNGQIFVLMLDNDPQNPDKPDELPAGQKATQELKEGLSRLNIPYLLAEYEYKDPNEYLTNDREGMKRQVSFLQAEAERLRNENKYNAAELLDYFKDIENRQPGFEVKTGFENLDRELAGGLHEGLIVIGAISSLGKTTFTLQLADQIAAAGQDVIFFSLEMSKYELIAKSISRFTYSRVRDRKTENGYFLARDTMQILNNRKYQYYTQEEKDVIAQAIKDYEAPAAHVFIYEGRYKGERLTVQHIREIVKNHVETTKRKPVVFVDYLQIIAPEDVRGTDKQNTDISVFELKEISRDFTIPVVAISSFNRENYMQPVSMASYKESGAVEYSSDILFGLQYAGMDFLPGEGSEKDKKRNERIRDIIQGNQAKKRQKEPIEIELKCLKNRNGYTFTVPLLMLSAFNHFEEKEGFRPLPDGTESPFESPFGKYKK